MALNLKTDIQIIIKDGDDILLDERISSKSLMKKDRKKIGKLVSDAQSGIEDDAMEAIEEMEKAAKLRFDLQISGDGKDKVKAIAEEYGYSMILAEIDKLVRSEQGKQ